MVPTDPDDVALVLRPATAADLPAIAEVHIRARDAAYPAMPRSLHPPDEAHAWVAGWDLATYDVWLGETEDQVAGYARLGFYEGSSVALIAIGLPLVVIGSWLGDRVIRRVDPAKFGWLVGGLIFLSGVALLVK